jgi:hypothetical protein
LERLLRSKAVTLIAAVRCKEGIILTADSEETLGDALKTNNEKLRLIQPYAIAASRWMMVLAGAGDVEYIRMAGDLIEERLQKLSGTDTEIITAIRQSIHQMWSDFAVYEPGGRVSLELLGASFSSDGALRLTVYQWPSSKEWTRN